MCSHNPAVLNKLNLSNVVVFSKDQAIPIKDSDNNLTNYLRKHPNFDILKLLFADSVIRKATRKRKVFPTDDSARKVIYLAIQAASKKWTMPIRNWKAALNRFMIEFEEQLAPHI